MPEDGDVVYRGGEPVVPVVPADQQSDRHPHEPDIPPTWDPEGRCLVCGLQVEIDRLRAQRAQLQHDRRGSMAETYGPTDPCECGHGRLSHASAPHHTGPCLLLVARGRYRKCPCAFYCRADHGEEVDHA